MEWNGNIRRIVDSSFFCKKTLKKHTSHILIPILEGLDRISISTISYKQFHVHTLSLSRQNASDKTLTQPNVSDLVGLNRENAPLHQMTGFLDVNKHSIFTFKKPAAMKADDIHNTGNGITMATHTGTASFAFWVVANRIYCAEMLTGSIASDISC
jgi:hypothetical protein